MEAKLISKQSGVGQNDQIRIFAACKIARQTKGFDKLENAQMISQILNTELGNYWNVFIYDTGCGAGYKWYSNDKQLKFDVNGWTYDIFQTAE